MGDEFAGIEYFPFASTELSLLAVNHRILELAETRPDILAYREPAITTEPPVLPP
jgi:hypothetical protein